MRRYKSAITAAAALLTGLAACAGGTGNAEPVPAVLVSPDEDDIAEVSRAAEKLTGTSRVILSDDVLTDSPELILDRRMPRSLQGDPAGGRIMERPPRLSLIKKGDACLLVHDETGESEVLSGVECTPFRAP